jgi:hypothetical protein
MMSIACTPAQSKPPPQLAVNRLWIKGISLPHFQLIDGSAGDEIAAQQPGLLCIPGCCPLLAPFRLLDDLFRLHAL